MILQALNSLYYRLLDDRDEDVPGFGFSKQKISFGLVISPQGELVRVEDLRVDPPKGKKLLPRMMTVPEPVKRTSGVAANFLWDNTGYVLGADEKSAPDKLRDRFEAFRARAREIGGGLDDPDVKAVLAFLDSWNPEDAPSLEYWDEMKGLNLVFRLQSQRRFAHDTPAARKAWSDFQGVEAENAAMCLVTGKNGPAARLHPAVKGVRGAQSSGAALVSFNLDAFTSYGKDQNFNAPVGERAAFAYTTALNHMLARDSGQKQELGQTSAAMRKASYGDKRPPRRKSIMVGDATTLFWTEKPTRAESQFLAMLDIRPDKDSAQDHELLLRLSALIESVRKGERPPPTRESETPFYVLGLSPNAARLSVRFWRVSSVAAMEERLGRHFADLEMEKQFKTDPDYLNVWNLLLETAPQRKTENIPPNLGGELMRAVISGSDYPYSLVSRIITRIRADHAVNRSRAAMLKAYYVRAGRNGRKNTPNLEDAVTLDPKNTNIGYVLGRMFAVLEKAQQDALPGINATIKDRFYGAASSTPRSVFPRLLSLANHHISKAEHGGVSEIMLARISELIDPKTGYPAHLDLDGQAMFSLGYYHQRNDNYRPNEEKRDPIKKRSE